MPLPYIRPARTQFHARLYEIKSSCSSNEGRSVVAFGASAGLKIVSYINFYQSYSQMLAQFWSYWKYTFNMIWKEICRNPFLCPASIPHKPSRASSSWKIFRVKLKPIMRVHDACLLDSYYSSLASRGNSCTMGQNSLLSCFWKFHNHMNPGGIFKKLPDWLG